MTLTERACRWIATRCQERLILKGDETYLARYYVWPRDRDDDRRDLTRPWWTWRVLLHRIELPDTDRHLHDHPWAFASIVLVGGYIEERPSVHGTPWAQMSWRRPWTFAFRRASALHRIRHVEPGTWTLIICGPRRREWGYGTPKGWVRWDRYWGLDHDDRGRVA
jgi:hypothetical protein